MIQKKNATHEIFNNEVVRATLVGVLSILALFLLAQTIDLAKNFGRQSMPATDTVTVQGTGQATLPPDVARISFTIERSSATVANAQAAATKQANAALAFVKGQNIAEKDVKTLSYTISPQYASVRCPKNTSVCPPPKIVGYQVSETFQVTVRTLSKVGAFLAGLGNLDVQNVGGPAFALDDETAGYNAARADAINKAKSQATLLAKQLGVSLGKIVNFSESSGAAYPMYSMMDAKMSSAPNIPAGENNYTASVSITYEIR